MKPAVVLLGLVLLLDAAIAAEGNRPRITSCILPNTFVIKL